MAEEETVIDFDQFLQQESSDVELMPIEEYGTFDLCTIYTLEATSQTSGKWFSSQIPCEEIAESGLCGGHVELIRYDLPSQIKWKCKKCESHGKIIHFKGTEWDIRQFPKEKQQQIMSAYISQDDPLTQIEQLPDEELQDFFGFVDEYMDNLGVGSDMRDESGGLNSKQLYRLLDCDWQSPDSPLKLNKNLPQDEIDRSLLFHNARAFLLYLNEQGALPATGQGNLKRKAVSALIKQFRWPEGYIEEIKDRYTAINEKQVPLLHKTRVLLELSELIYLADGTYHLNEIIVEILEDDRAGELYCWLFYTYFKEMNIGYISDFDDFIGIQEVIPYTLYMLYKQDEGWHSIVDSAESILLPSIHNQLDLDGIGLNYLYEFLIKPLAYFGLIETAPPFNEINKAYGVPNNFRKKPLLNQLLSVDADDLPPNGQDANIIPINNKTGNTQTTYFIKQEKERETRVYQLKITLNDTSPSIWRRVLVSSDTLLPDLHKIIQSSMGWSNGHLHQFVQNGQRYSKPAPDWPNDDIDYREVRVDKLLKKEKQALSYVYDFGDGWRHTILLEKTLPIDSGRSYPVCTAGKRNCPPEDCGGPWGYQQMLEALNDPSHPEHDMFKGWMGPNFDPEHFNKEKVNTLLHSKNYGILDVF